MKLTKFICSIFFLIVIGTFSFSCSDDEMDGEAGKFVGTWVKQERYNKYIYFQFNKDGTAKELIYVDYSSTWGDISKVTYDGIWRYDKDSKMLITTCQGQSWKILDVTENSWSGLQGETTYGETYDRSSYTIEEIMKW